MAMDSHDDDHYELLIIDTVNNNHNEKSSNSSAGQNGNPECGSHISSHAVGTLSGSSRRKCSTLSKGITIEEFLETVDPSNQLTAIDKLILKNKAALAEDQMKRVRVKPKDKSTANQKKGDKNTKTKVLSSKLANSKHGKPNDANDKNKNNTVKSKNSKTKITTKVATDKSKKIAKSFPKVEKTEVRLVNSEVKCKTESRPSNSDLKMKTEARILNGDQKNKAPKKPTIIETKGVRNNDKATTNRKTLFQGVRKLKKEPKINCKSFDMKRLKSNVAYRTRSVNNEKLRNGKTRIIRVLPDEKLPETKKKYSKPKDGTSSSNITPNRSILKRPIKQEPNEEDNGPARKRKNSEPSVPLPAKNNDENADVGNISQSMDIDERFLPKLTVKEEPIKEDIDLQSDSTNLVEINVNMNISSDSESKEFTLKPENITNFPEDTPVPYGLMIKNYCSVPDIKEDTETLLVNSVNEEGSQDDDTSESLNLQLDNLDDDLEEIEVDDQSCNSTETESVIDEMNEKNTNTREVNGQLTADDSTRDTIFSALGLQSIERNCQKSKEKEIKEENYRGTLKMVIKTDKGCRRMEMKQADNSSSEPAHNENLLSFYSKTIHNGNDRTTLNSSPTESSDSSAMSSLIVEDDADKDGVKTLISEVPTVNIVKETTSVGNGDEIGKDVDKSSTDKSKGDDASLIVPEKSSSFSIHPNRLCSDVCKYCFGKFGSLDTPCHVGQLKNLERQKTILGSEPNLQIDTCLCDACFRFVDRKANRSSNKRKTIRPSSLGQRKVICAVLNCNQAATKLYSKRKWRSKICRKFANLSFDIRRRGNRTGLGLCFQHFNMLDMYTLCGICKKRLNRNDMYSVRSEVNDLNVILIEDGIPVKLMDNMLLCKYCHHCMSLRLNFGDPSQMTKSNKDYYESFKKEVFRYLRVGDSDSEQKKIPENQMTETTGIFVPEKANNKVTEVINDNHSSLITNTAPPSKHDSNTTTSKKSHNVDMNGIANLLKPLEGEKSCESKTNRSVGINDIASLLKPLEGEHSKEKNSTHIQLKFGNLNIGKLSNLNIGQNTQSLPVPEKKSERFSEDAELPLKADFSFDNDDSSRGWERCVSTIQFDRSTKKLWQDLQKPYGNQSSFIRHLIMLEKYWRNGALVLSDSADSGAVKYISSVKNRIESLEVFSAPKLPPIPALAPAPPLTPLPILQKPVIRKPEKLALTPPPLQPAPKPPQLQPPPLLKLNCLSSYVGRKSTPICTVRPSPEFSIKTVRTSLPAPPKLERIPSMYLNTTKSIPVPTNRGMMQSQIRSKQQIIQMEAIGKGRTGTVPVLKRSPSLTNGTSSVVRTFPSHYVAKPTTTMSLNHAPSSMIISKLPKALTVTQIDDVVVKDRKEIKPPQIAAPFLAGEKPSVSVFREISK